MPRHRELAQALLALIRRREVVELPGFGPTVLPGPLGFQRDGGAVRLSPSYLALHQLRALAREDSSGPWDAIAAGMPRLLAAVAPRGLVPDWVRHGARLGWHAADDSPPLGSFDAIRTYLCAGLAHATDPLRPALLQATRGMAALLRAGTPLPQQVRTDTGQTLGSAPAGFSAALLPWLRATGRTRLLAAQQARLRALSAGGDAWPAGCVGGLTGQPPTYYDQVLALFGTGAVENRFRFDAQGRLVPAWAR